MKNVFDEIPYIEGEHIIIRKITDADADELQAMIQSKKVYRYLPTFLFEQQYTDIHEMIRKLYDECFAAKESLILAVCRKEDGSFCGLAEYYGFKDEIHAVCIGLRLVERCWGCGIATEAIALMVNYLYTQTDTEIITASSMIENDACTKALKKNGFSLVKSGAKEDWGYDHPTLANKWIR